ncbi:MAG: hypothetical protein AAF899_04115 [Pseudomonadota bacterium]
MPDDGLFDPWRRRRSGKRPLAVPSSPLGAIPAALARPGGAITMVEKAPLGLWQIDALPGRHAAVADAIAAELGAAAPDPGRLVRAGALSCLRIAPRQWWLLREGDSTTPAAVTCEAPSPVACSAEDATALDLAHARCRLIIGGWQRLQLMARLVSLDLRPCAIPVDHVASTALHGVGITLVVEADRIVLFLPRSHARSMAAFIAETAEGLLA